jgi:hypothetical protein
LNFFRGLLHPVKIDILKVSIDQAQRLAGILARMSADREGGL